MHGEDFDHLTFALGDGLDLMACARAVTVSSSAVN